MNKFARKERHLKVFSRGKLVQLKIVEFAKSSLRPIGLYRDKVLSTRVGYYLKAIFHYLLDTLPSSPQKKLLFQGILISVVAVSATSFTSTALFTPASLTYTDDYIEAYSLPGDILVSDEEGYLVKINPQTDKSNRIGLTDYAVHTIQSGESLSLIAQQYEVSAETIMWENNMGNANSIRTGQKLMIPPVDGIGYKVKSGDNLEKIAKKYEISAESIIAQNSLESEIIAQGQNLFLPGAKPIIPVSTVGSNYRATTASRDYRASSYASTNSTETPALGKIFIFPTIGKITQGYRRGHYALDIADRGKPPIWAAAGGTITKASSGTWGGGYGNHVIVDHGDGVESLYAHLDSLDVAVGDSVSQGDVIGVMGNTGLVYGVTGIHLHWEVIVNGVKQNPANYY